METSHLNRPGTLQPMNFLPATAAFESRRQLRRESLRTGSLRRDPSRPATSRLKGLRLAVSSLAACLIFDVSSGANGEGPPPVPVTVARVQGGAPGATNGATGAVASRNDAAISAEVSGRLLWIAEPGTRIERNGVLARIEARDLQLGLRDSEAAVRRIDAEVRLLAAQRDRLNTLGQTSAVSRSQLEEATARHEMSAQQLEQARVTRDRAALMLERTVIRAPFAGAVAERLHSTGEYVTPGTALARLVDTRNVEVVARAPLNLAGSVKPGSVATLEMGGARVTGKVRAVVPVGDERSRLLELRIAVADVEWPVGAPVRVELVNAERSAGVSVPRDAVILRQAATYVYRVAKGNTAERVPVTVGAGRGESVAVVGDLRAGDLVVVRGGERLQPGQAVTVTNERQSVASR
jgi:RND family efflux transporter MFP subunit